MLFFSFRFHHRTTTPHAAALQQSRMEMAESFLTRSTAKKYCSAISLSKLEFACNVRFTRRLDSSISALVGIYVRIIGKLEFACEFQDAQQEAAVGPDHKSLPRPRDGHVQSAVVRQETQRAALVRTHLVIFSGHFRLNCNRRGVLFPKR